MSTITTAPSKPLPTNNALKAKNAIRAKSPSYDDACKKTSQAKQDVMDANNNLQQKKNDISKLENKKQIAKNKIEANNDKIEANNKAIVDLKVREEELYNVAIDNSKSPEEVAAANEAYEKVVAERKALESENSTLATENGDLTTENGDLTTENGNLEDGIEDYDKDIETAENELSALENDVSKSEDIYSESLKNEEKIKEQLAEDFPEIYKDMVDAVEVAKEQDESNLKTNAENIEKDKENAEIAKKRAAIQAKIDAEKKRIADLNKIVNDPNASIREKQNAATQLYDTTHKIEELKKKTAEDLILDQIYRDSANKLKSENEGAYLKFDAKMANTDGELEKIISQHIQPKNKHAYMGEFPSKLSDLDWMVKTIDRPKVDIESIEQIRFNVKRQYPVKYNIGDVSVTFWDDVDHKTVSTLYSYFAGDVWDHKSVGNTGTFLLRDSILIPVFSIYDLSVETNKHLEYKFENAVLSSFDFDAADDEGDETVYTVQAVFKVEKFNVIQGSSPRVLKKGNSPIWR